MGVDIGTESALNVPMNIKLGTIVERPVIQGGVVVAYEFLGALVKLSAEPLPVKDRYRLGQALDIVEKHVRLYEQRRMELVDALRAAAGGDEAKKEFEGQLALEHTAEVELPLPSRIRIPENSKLSGHEMRLLKDLIEV